METRRQYIIELLCDDWGSLQHLANHFRVEMREISEDLEHIRRSMKETADLQMRPAQCKGCGFAFRERTRLKTPSRCPKCRHERIEPASFMLKERKH